MTDPLSESPYTILLELTPFEAAALLHVLNSQDMFFSIVATQPIANALSAEGVRPATSTELINGALQ